MMSKPITLQALREEAVRYETAAKRYEAALAKYGAYASESTARSIHLADLAVIQEGEAADAAHRFAQMTAQFLRATYPLREES
jgi:hypothetical protein